MDDPEFSLISQQVTSGVAVRMALLYLMGSGVFLLIYKYGINQYCQKA